MRRILKLSLTCLAAGVVTACDIDTVIETQAVPTAGVRFIHAVPDTAQMDFRFVDIVESNPHFNIAFRNNIVISPTGNNGVPASTFVQYKAARAGARRFKIFMQGACDVNACDQSYASTAIATTVSTNTPQATFNAATGEYSVTLEEGKLYTALLWGYSNPGRMDTTITDANTLTPDTTIAAPAGLPAGAPAMRLDFFEETIANVANDPGTNVAMRVINATATAIDASFFPSAGAPPAAGSETWQNVAPFSMSAFATAAPAIYRYNVQNVGSATNLFANSRALLGAEAVTEAPGPIDAVPGTTVAGSAVTGIVFPRSVSGTSQAPNFTTPAISFVWDRRPPRPSGV